MRIKIAKKKHRKINDSDAILDWCDANLAELADHLEQGCDYAVWWLQAMERFERTDAQDDYVAYVATILKFIASHHPELLGSEYQWAVEIERNNGGMGTLQ